ncbi:16S rRNA (adenine(1518)-N(6)/adenine(1519)-N(6))-dimethyltransferase RsmA [Thiohalorhabdus sp.]|uniref:16S rRNA (adenine(1518)-N(6)/adenine(1519)-N(6))- dimethyltransferase RsmA n=1 Tax=Thiohalorhabdus sp. TaxID=3094134 RepID=UPI002FC33B4E
MPDHRPSKRFGQNFLNDANIVGKIVDAIDPQPGEPLVEIGPGRGALTRALLERVDRLDAVEVDRDLAPELETLATTGELTVHVADALAFDFAALGKARGGPLRVVGNLPYNISSPLLFHLFSQLPAMVDMHFMLQREVVERLAAQPGSKTYGRLSVMVQTQCQVTPLFQVPPGAFYPEPKVTSAMVRLRPNPADAPRPRDQAAFSAVVARAFQARRKTLRNALKGLCGPERIGAAGIDPGARAETLSVADYIRLADNACGSSEPEKES